MKLQQHLGLASQEDWKQEERAAVALFNGNNIDSWVSYKLLITLLRANFVSCFVWGKYCAVYFKSCFYWKETPAATILLIIKMLLIANLKKLINLHVCQLAVLQSFIWFVTTSCKSPYSSKSFKQSNKMSSELIKKIRKVDTAHQTHHHTMQFLKRQWKQKTLNWGDFIVMMRSALKHCLFKMMLKLSFFTIYLGLWIQLPLNAWHA